MKRLFLFISLIAVVSACNIPNRNQNTPAKNDVNSNQSKVDASKPSESVPPSDIPYSPPPMPRVSKAAPTAIEVAQVLKQANIFPKTNRVVENSLNDLDKKEGAVTSINIASARVEGMTIKVYESIDQRNQARLRMVKECPGCNGIVECGSILMYEPTPGNMQLPKNFYKLEEEKYQVLKRYFHCD